MVNDTYTNGFWWEQRWFLALLVVASVVPLMWPSVPPLVDLPGHMGRYAVELDATSPILSQWYDFRWRLIGNSGVDLLIVPMARVFGLELGVKLIILAIPAMTTAGFLLIAREVHGRVPPTAFFALPLAYGHPFLFGFVNFALGVAFTLLAFALWLRMTRLRRTRWRPAVFSVIACVIWVTHTFAWGLLGVLCLAAEIIRQRDLGYLWHTAVFRAGIACLPMALPLIPMVVWQSQTRSSTGDWFDLKEKSHYLATTLRDRWQVFDVGALALIFGVVLMPLVVDRLGYSRMLIGSTFFLIIVFFTLPRVIFGSAYADMRLTPFLFANAVIAIRPLPGVSRRLLNGLAILGLLFVGARTASTTASFAIVSARWDRALIALDHLPRGARVAAFTPWTCAFDWSTDRMDHLPGLAIVRRQAFSNDQWQVSGTSFMTVTKSDAAGFVADPSQLVTEQPCHFGNWRSLDQSLAKLPRAAFDYVWLIDPPRYDRRLTFGMTPVWANGTDRLYRIDRK